MDLQEMKRMLEVIDGVPADGTLVYIEADDFFDDTPETFGLSDWDTAAVVVTVEGERRLVPLRPLKADRCGAIYTSTAGSRLHRTQFSAILGGLIRDVEYHQELAEKSWAILEKHFAESCLTTTAE